MSDHLIHRLTFDIGNLRNEAEYNKIAKAIFNAIQTSFKLKIETILDRYDFNDYHVVINYIEIDLGDFEIRNFHNNLLDELYKYMDNRFDRIERIIEAAIKENAYKKEISISELSGLDQISLLRKDDSKGNQAGSYVQSHYVSNIVLKENQYLDAVSFYLLNGWLPYYLNIPQHAFAEHLLSTISNNLNAISSFIGKQTLEKQKQIQQRLSHFMFTANSSSTELSSNEKKKLLEENQNIEGLIAKVTRNVDAVAYESRFTDVSVDQALKNVLLKDMAKPYFTNTKTDNLGLLIRVFVEYIETGKTTTNILPYYITSISEVINQLYKRAPVILKELFTNTNIFKQSEKVVQSRIVHLYSQLRKSHVNFLLQSHISNAQKWQKPLNAINELFNNNVDLIPQWLAPIKESRRAHAFLFFNLVQREHNLGTPMVDFAKDLLFREAIVLQQPKRIRTSFEKVLHFFTSKESFSNNNLKSVIKNIDRLYKGNKSSLVTIFEAIKKSGLKETEIRSKLISLAEYAGVDVLDKVLSVFYGDSNVIRHSEIVLEKAQVWSDVLDMEKRIRLQLLFDTISNTGNLTNSRTKKIDSLVNFLESVAAQGSTSNQNKYLLFKDWVQKNESFILVLSSSKVSEKLSLTELANSFVSISKNIVRYNQELQNTNSGNLSDSLKRNILELATVFENEISGKDDGSILENTVEMLQYFDKIGVTKKGLTVEFVEAFLQYKGLQNQIDALDTIVSYKEIVEDKSALSEQLLSDNQSISLKRIKQVIDFGHLISEKSIKENYYKNTSKYVHKWIKENKQRVEALNELESHLEKDRKYSIQELKLLEYVKEVKEELEYETEEDSQEMAIQKLIVNMEKYFIPRTGNKNNTLEKILTLIPSGVVNKELKGLSKKLTAQQVIDNPSLRKLDKKTFEKLLELLLQTDTYRTFIKWRERYKKMFLLFATEYEINIIFLALTTDLKNLNEDNLIPMFLELLQKQKGWTNYRLKTDCIRLFEEFGDDFSDVQREIFRTFVSNISTAEKVQDNALMAGLDQGIAIKNAGLVLLWPFMKILFKLAGLMNDFGEFHDKEAKQRAVFLLQYLAVKQSEGDEPYIVFNKIFVGLELDEPMPTGITLTDKEKDICDSLLMNTIKQWTALGKSSPDNLRGTFIIRDGVLHFRDGAWHLIVEGKSFDLLLGKLPWSYSMIKVSWLPYIITVDWN